MCKYLAVIALCLVLAASAVGQDKDGVDLAYVQINIYPKQIVIATDDDCHFTLVKKGEVKKVTAKSVTLPDDRGGLVLRHHDQDSVRVVYAAGGIVVFINMKTHYVSMRRAEPG